MDRERKIYTELVERLRKLLLYFFKILTEKLMAEKQETFMGMYLRKVEKINGGKLIFLGIHLGVTVKGMSN